MTKKKAPRRWTKRGKDSYRLQVCCDTAYTGKPNIYTHLFKADDHSTADHIETFFDQITTNAKQK